MTLWALDADAVLMIVKAGFRWQKSCMTDARHFKVRSTTQLILGRNLGLFRYVQQDFPNTANVLVEDQVCSNTRYADMTVFVRC